MTTIYSYACLTFSWLLLLSLFPLKQHYFIFYMAFQNSTLPYISLYISSMCMSLYKTILPFYFSTLCKYSCAIWFLYSKLNLWESSTFSLFNLVYSFSLLYSIKQVHVLRFILPWTLSLSQVLLFFLAYLMFFFPSRKMPWRYYFIDLCTHRYTCFLCYMLT